MSLDERIAILESFAFEDAQPLLEAPNLAIGFESSGEFEGLDRCVFRVVLSLLCCFLLL